MKIFGWIQCKLRNSSSVLLKDSANGLLKDSGQGRAPCLLMKPSWNNQHEYLRPKNGTKHSKHEHFERYLSECSMEKVQEAQFGDVTEETFPGFLTIGTLNMEEVTTADPATPTFGFLPGEEENEDHNKAEMSYDLKLINEELEKFLKTEAENEGFNESRRTSVASTITLSGKETDGIHESKMAFPLQGYLFASSYDISVSEDEKEKEKEKASLFELFRRSREVDKDYLIKLNIIKECQAIEKYKAPIHPMRRILQTLQPSSKKIEALRDPRSTQSSSTNKRFRKIKKLFKKKVHPEGPAGDEESKYKNEKTGTNMCMPSNGGPSTSRKCYNKGNVGSANSVCKTSLKNKSNHTNVEHWIKTDADYLVLELGEK